MLQPVPSGRLLLDVQERTEGSEGERWAAPAFQNQSFHLFVTISVSGKEKDFRGCM